MSGAPFFHRVPMLGKSLFAKVRAMGPAAWYRADQGHSIDTGVDQWNDISGNGRHLLQATGTKQPTYSSSGGRRGFGYLEFNGGTDPNNQHMEASFALEQPTHMFLVMRKESDTTSGGVGKTAIDGIAANGGRIVIASDTQLQSSAGSAVLFNGATTAWGCIEVEWNGASGRSRFNDDSYTATSHGTNDMNGITLAAYGTPTFGTVNMRVEELILFPRILPASEVSVVSRYVGN